jgi:hypothetical protein
MAASLEDVSAQTFLNDFFASRGLATLGTWAWDLYKQGVSVDEIKLRMYDTPEFKTRYPAYETLAKAGRAISVDAYQAYEKTTRDMLHQYGIPAGMYDTPESISKLLINDVAPTEMNTRLQIAAAAAYSAPQEVRDALQNQYGVQGGGLIGYFLDPDKATPILQRQWEASQVTGAAYRQKLALDVAEAERLAAQGVGYDEAVQGFGQVAAQSALGTGSGETVDQNTQVAAVFGDAAALSSVQRVQRSRAAQFGGGGGAQDSQQGVTGLGSSSS